MKTKDKILRISLVVLTYLICVAILIFTVQPQSFIIAVGDVASETIKATFDVEDSITTQQLMDEASASVTDIYRLNSAITDEVLISAGAYFKEIENVRVIASHELRRLIEKNMSTDVSPRVTASPEEVEPVITPAPTAQIQVVPELSLEFIDTLSSQLPVSLSENDIRSLAQKSSMEISSIQALILEKLALSLEIGRASCRERV